MTEMLDPQWPRGASSVVIDATHRVWYVVAEEMLTKLPAKIDGDRSREYWSDDSELTGPDVWFPWAGGWSGRPRPGRLLVSFGTWRDLLAYVANGHTDGHRERWLPALLEQLPGYVRQTKRRDGAEGRSTNRTAVKHLWHGAEVWSWL